MSIATVDNVREAVCAVGPFGKGTGGGVNLLRYGADAAETVQHRFVGRHGGRPLQSEDCRGGRPLRSGDRHAASDRYAADTVHRLREKLERYRRRRARRAGWTKRFIPTGVTPVDEVLPHGGLPCGAVTEILSDGPGVGAMTLAVRVAARSIGLEDGGGEGVPVDAERGRNPATARPSDRRCLVLIDSLGDFYPPAVCRYGIPLDRLVVLRPQNARDAFWAVDQSLRCAAVAAVIAPLNRLDERASRRLQLAAESSGCLGLVLRSTGRVDKSFAAVRMLVEGKTGDVRANTFSRATPFMTQGEPAHDACICRITLLTVREGMPAGPLEVDLHDETGAGPVHPVPVDRPAAKTG